MATLTKHLLPVSRSPRKLIGANRRKNVSIYRPLWEYIPLSQYKRPTTPASETLRGYFVSSWRRLRPTPETAAVRDNSFDAMPPYLLNRAATTPDLPQITSALESTMDDRSPDGEPGPVVTVIVGPPGSHVSQVVTMLAHQKRWRLLGAPSVTEILSGGHTWLQNATGGEIAPLVIPHLGRCYLRHQHGLDLMSRLVDWLQSTRRRCLIACDSWAWSYLVKAHQIDVLLPPPLTLSPLDGARLQFWLPSLAFTNKGRFVFRDASSGQLIFPMADSYRECLEQNATPGQMEHFGEWIGVGRFLKQLAAYGRGLPLVIWSLWRAALQVSAGEGLDKLRGQLCPDEWYTVWVKPWSKMKLPAVPGTMGTTACILLHTLLLHGGASVELLDLLLPFSSHQVRRVLHQLLAAGVVEAGPDKRWQITLLGYPRVRQFLEDEGYLLDAF